MTTTPEQEGRDPVSPKAQHEFADLIKRALEEQVSESSRKQTVVGGGLIGALFIGLVYFGQGQLSRLDRVVEDVSAMRSQIGVIQSRVDQNSALRVELEGVRALIRDHERSAAHPAADAKIALLEQRIALLERARLTGTDDR